MIDLTGVDATSYIEVITLGLADIATEVVLPNDWTKVAALFETNSGKFAFTGTDGAAIMAAYGSAPADSWTTLIERTTRNPSRRSVFLASATPGTVVRLALGGVSTSTSAWNHTETITPIEAQADYLFTGIGTADTTAAHALVTWGSTVLIPDTDYSILADRLRLSPTCLPSAGDAASGAVITVRVYRT